MKGLLKLVYKMSKIEKLCLCLLVILIITQFRLPTQETFSIQNKKYVLLDNHSLYDTFYASVYDNLLFEPNKNAFSYPLLFNSFKEEGYSGYFGAEYQPTGHTEDTLEWMRDFQA